MPWKSRSATTWPPRSNSTLAHWPDNPTLQIAVYILAGIATIEAGGLVPMRIRLRRIRQETEQPRERLDARNAVGWS
ncbi:Uncharacterised protein [Mycobacterium tuberculosis]|uniref:Transmembrane protein n=1 Tax=Mycobacterium tuberculosis TaxID=1773 RepID=A0A655IBD5_MYCTX|nr:Uncharacterised protein [Mycobacterium tuberculosis]